MFYVISDAFTIFNLNIVGDFVEFRFAWFGEKIKIFSEFGKIHFYVRFLSSNYATEAHVEPSPISTMEIFCENS